MEEVVVTAQKREERLQDVPISISVLGGTDLDSSQVQGVAEAVKSVPSVADIPASRGGNMPLFIVRGVTAASAFTNGASPIAYYLDSVPFGFVRSAFSPEASPYDLDRIEVLRGPQGTLYGMSALNGVVRILTKDADVSTFELKGRASASNTDDGADSYRGDMAINAPLVEGKLAARAVLGYQDLGGWIDRPNQKDANDSKIKTGRLKLNSQPTDALSIGLSAWFSRGDYGAPPISPDGRQVPIVRPETSAQDYDVYSAKLDYKFSAVSVTSATSYIDQSTNWVFDGFAFSAPAESWYPTRFAGEVFSQEIYLSSTHSGPWQWTAGGIYRDSKETFQQGFMPSIPVLFDDAYTSESFALFSELTRLFLDGRFGVTAGVRYFEDKVTDNYKVTTVNPDEITKTSHFDAVSPRVVVTWHPSTQSTLYASYGEGFRSGVTQTATVQRLAPSFSPAEPDTLKNYEIGGKTILWDGRASVETAIFYMDWQDVQQVLAVPVGGTLVSGYVNAPSASGMGFEFAATVEPVAELTLTASYGWNDLTVDEDFVNQTATGPVVRFRKGTRLGTSPKSTAFVSAGYSVPLGAGGFRGRVSASTSYTSKLQSRAVRGTRTVATEADSILLARAALAVESPDRWIATLFADNIFNNNDVVVRDGFSDTWNTRLRPRTIGLQLEYRY